MDVFIDVEGHSPMPLRKFRPADTLERLKTIIQETLAIPLLDQELWCNGKVVGNVPIVKDMQSLVNAGIKDGGTVHVNMGWNVDEVLIPQWSLEDPWAIVCSSRSCDQGCQGHALVYGTGKDAQPVNRKIA
jgi:hypothetical protein